MTRTSSRPPWRTVAVAATVCALVGAGTSAAFADDLSVEPLSPPAVDAPADESDDPFEPFRADPRRAAQPGPRELRATSGATTLAEGSIAGKVTYTDITQKSLKPLTTGVVQVMQWDEALQDLVTVAEATTTSTGAYTVTGVPAGTYTVGFFDVTSGSKLLPEFWKDAPLLGWSQDVVVADGAAVTGIDERLEPMLTGYIAGPDRYATSIAISQSGFDGEVPCVYVASGANFPDALSAGPAAAKCGGPLLLVPPTTLPSNVAAELARLSPEKIVIAGGTGAVSSGVATKLKAYAPNVTRVAGKDRYETSRKLVQYAFDTVPEMWVATGANFPDALAASAAGAVGGVPVLTVPGTATKLDSASASVITSLSPDAVGIAGGTGVVSTGVAKSIDALPGVSVVRFAGADRYETAYKINRVVWDPQQWSSVYTFLINGTKFPDALAGAALAGRISAPMHVVPPTCTPAAVANHIADLDVYEVYLLGYFSQLSFSGKPFKIC